MLSLPKHPFSGGPANPSEEALRWRVLDGASGPCAQVLPTKEQMGATNWQVLVLSFISRERPGVPGAASIAASCRPRVSDKSAGWGWAPTIKAGKKRQAFGEGSCSRLFWGFAGQEVNYLEPYRGGNPVSQLQSPASLSACISSRKGSWLCYRQLSALHCGYQLSSDQE